MPGCDVLDLRCIFLNELIGSVLLAVLMSALVYFIVASKLRWGFDTTIVMIFPLLLIVGLMFAGFSAVFAFATVIVGIMVGWVFNEIIRNR